VLPLTSSSIPSFGWNFTRDASLWNITQSMQTSRSLSVK
jgi:hypothetical protein